MRIVDRLLCAASWLAIVLSAGCGESAELIHLDIAAPDVDCIQAPVHAQVTLPDELAGDAPQRLAVEVAPADGGASVPGQITKEQDGQLLLWWVPPIVKAGQETTWMATIKPESGGTSGRFAWQDVADKYTDLLLDGRKVARYMRAYDTSTDESRFETYKPFLHVYDERGENLLTNGPDGEQPYAGKRITYPHHRGIFIGWNRLACEGRRYDLWHMTGGLAQVHQRFEEREAGPVLARFSALIGWNDRSGKPIVSEHRHVAVFRQADPALLLLDCKSELTAVRGDVLLDGDPEHAGFQYRAHNDVAAGPRAVKARYVFHADGIDAHRDGDLPWVAMSYGLNDRRYVVLHVNHPDNPKPTMYSAYRDYGRFGAFFKHLISKGDTLVLRYRIWIAGGEMPARDDLANRHWAFVHGLRADVAEP